MSALDDLEISLGEVGRRVGSAASSNRLAACGLLGPVTYHGTRRYVRAAAADALLSREEITPHDVPPALLVRMGPPRASQEGWREESGWHEGWSTRRQIDAIRGDWVVEPATVLSTGHLIALVAGFVVAAYTVVSLDQREWNKRTHRYRSRFVLDENPALESRVLQRRWALTPGWTVAIHGPRDRVGDE